MARQWGIFVGQTTCSWLVLAVLLIVSNVISPAGVEYDGIGTIIGTLLFVFISGVGTNLIVALIGLPLRLVADTRSWLERSGRYLLIGAAVGIALFLGFLPLESEILYWLGWFLTAFAVVHTWWPRAWIPSGAQQRELDRKIARGRALRDSADA